MSSTPLSSTNLTLLLLASLLPGMAAQAGQETVFFGDSAAGGRAPIVWGGGSYARIVSSNAAPGSACIQLRLDTPGAYSGMILQLERPADLRADRASGVLSFRIRGAEGGEKLGISLIDSYGGIDDFDLNTTVALDAYTAVSREWQTVQIPLPDFPTAGVNWVRPPTDKLPHTGPFDWRNVESVMFIIQGKPLTVWLDEIVVRPVKRDAGGPRLTGRLNLSSDRPDFTRGDLVVIDAAFDRIADWRIRITGKRSGAVKTFGSVSPRLSATWDCGADKGRFTAEDCDVSLSAASPGDKKRKIIAGAALTVKRAHAREIKVNQAGYLPGCAKRAYVSGPSVKGRKFHVRDAATGETRWSGTVRTDPVPDGPSEESVTTLDFSAFEGAGEYLLEVEKLGASYPFTVGPGVYRKVFTDAMRSFYYQRCGSGLDEKYAGRWTRKACHLSDAVVHPSSASALAGPGMKVPCAGGWHDAGDLGKKVVPGAVALGHILGLYEMFPDRIASIRLNLPNPVAGQPDLLAEARYELEWMLLMQRKDGAVYHLVTTPDFAPPGVMPEDDGQTRYLTPVSSCATADFCAIMAVSARVYRAFDRAFAARCLDSATRAWKYLSAHPGIFPPGGYTDPPGINGTGAYADPSDREERFWAASEMFRTTGGEEYNRAAITGASIWTPAFTYPAGWTDPHPWGMLSYLFCGQPGVDQGLRDRIRSEFLAYAASILEKMGKNGYPSVLSQDQYYWGSNSLIMGYACDLIVAFTMTGEERFRDAALGQLDAVLGCNTLDLSFVTGTGTRSVRDPWHAASAWDGIDDPVPGFLPGGPNKYLDDPVVADAQKRHGLAPAACFVDSKSAYSANEVCLPYNSPLVFAAGYFSK
jgi:endoglucanase